MINLARLSKIWKLTTSPNAGEAAAAKNRAKAFVKRHGYTLADIPGLLGAEQKPQPSDHAAGGFSPFRGFDDYMEEKEPGYKAQRAREVAERRQREKDELAELLARYGGQEHIVALSPAEANPANNAALEALGVRFQAMPTGATI